MLRRALARLLFIAAVLASSHTSAVTVAVSATDLPDISTDDLWSYRFDLAGDIAVLESVRIAFDPVVHAPTGVETIADGWYTEFDPGQVVPFPADGHVLMSPVSDAAATPQSFVVNVVRRVAGRVEPLLYEVLDAGFDTIATGVTTTVAIPEPDAGLLCLAGLVVLGWRHREGRRRGTGTL